MAVALVDTADTPAAPLGVGRLVAPPRVLTQEADATVHVTAAPALVRPGVGTPLLSRTVPRLGGLDGSGCSTAVVGPADEVALAAVRPRRPPVMVGAVLAVVEIGGRLGAAA